MSGSVIGMARQVLREPIVHFLLIGVALVAMRQFAFPADDRHRIVVDEALVERLAESYASQFGTPPSSEELRSLVDRHVEDEMLYREGMALALAEDDVVIRRRIVQKMRFLMEDRSVVGTPTEDEVAAWYTAQADRYAVPETLAFTHVYFAIGEAGEEVARARAEEVLLGLRAEGVTRAPGRGDRFPGAMEFGATEPAALRRAFGVSDLSARLSAAPVGEWSGPYRSGYGWHLAYVSDRRPSHPAPLSEVRSQVERDLFEDRRSIENEAARARLREKYTILRIEEGAR